MGTRVSRWLCTQLLAWTLSCMTFPCNRSCLYMAQLHTNAAWAHPKPSRPFLAVYPARLFKHQARVWKVDNSVKIIASGHKHFHRPMPCKQICVRQGHCQIAEGHVPQALRHIIISMIASAESICIQPYNLWPGTCGQKQHIWLAITFTMAAWRF